MNKEGSLDFFKRDGWKKIKVLFEITGMAVILTLVQMIILYILLTVNLLHKYNVFLTYRGFFEKFLFVFNKMYFIFVNIMFKIFGESYLHVIGFNNVFKLAFFTIFLINLMYFAISRYSKSKNKEMLDTKKTGDE